MGHDSSHLAAPSSSRTSGDSAPNAPSALRQALDFDALHEASRLTGVSYKESPETEWLGIALMQEQRKVKNELLASNRDTNSWNQTLAEWMSIVEEMGFRLLLTEDIPGTRDKYRIWWRDGILLTADSYRGDATVNGSTAYFQYRGPRDALHKCSSGFLIEKDGIAVWDASRDAREGFRYALNLMAANGEFLSKWEQRRFLWLLHYGDTKTEDYDYEAITAARIAKLPEDVRSAIAGNPSQARDASGSPGSESPAAR